MDVDDSDEDMDDDNDDASDEDPLNHRYIVCPGKPIDEAFVKVCEEETDFISRCFEARGCTPKQHISLAFSGGGVRAAFFAAGVVWRLARERRLKDVDYISAVSGGTYTAASLASHITDAGSPNGLNVDDWYLELVSKMIIRMQHNTPYLARDLTEDPCVCPSDGSSILPRFFDIPIMLCVFAFRVLLPSVCVIAFLIVPLAECIEMFYGNDIRIIFCVDVGMEHADLALSGIGKLCSTSTIILFGLLAVFSAFVLQVVLQMLKKVSGSDRPKGWLCTRSFLSVLIRLFAVYIVFVVLVNGPLQWRWFRYSQVPYGSNLRKCQCNYFYKVNAKHHCSEVLAPFAMNQSSGVHMGGDFAASENDTLCTALFAPKSGSAEEQYGLLYNARRNILYRPVNKSFFPIVVAMMFFMMLFVIMLQPYFPALFAQTLQILAPAFYFLVTFFVVQWRVLGPITEEGFLAFGPSFEKSYWHVFAEVCLLTSTVVVVFGRGIRSAGHAFYSRSLRRAFFADGNDCTWRDVRNSDYCPFLLMNATANDYMRQEDPGPLSGLTFSPLHTGGERVGYMSEPGRRSLSRTSALSGGALDGFILGKYDSVQLRFYLELFGMAMGDYVKTRKVKISAQKIPSKILEFSVFALLFVSVGFTSRPSVGTCTTAMTLYSIAMSIFWTMIGVSFFDFLPCFEPLSFSIIVRSVHQATQFIYYSDKPPIMTYVTDGGVLENTGILQLMRRQSTTILSVWAEDENPEKEFNSLDKLMRLMRQEGIGSLFDLTDPRTSVWDTVRAYQRNRDECLVLGILYCRDENIKLEGRLIIVKNRVPKALEHDLPVRELLTEAEVLGECSAPPLPGDIQQTTLGGCCCDCCHDMVCNKCWGKFPIPPTSNQWLTPQMFNSLCRLSYHLTGSAMHHLGKIL